MATLIEKIAAQVTPMLPGVDWEALEERFGMSREELVFDTGTVGTPPEETGAFAYDIYIKAALTRAEVQLSQILLTSQVKDDPLTRENEIVRSMRAWEQVKKEAVTVGDFVLQALRSGRERLSPDNEFVIPREVFRAIITSTYLTCLYGAVVHARKLMQLEGAPGAEIVESAENITQTLNALAMLGEMGALDPLKPSAQATGATHPSVIIVVAIATAAVVGFLCFMIVTVQDEQNRNRLVRLYCEDAIKRGEAGSLDHCKELLEMNNQAHRGGPGAALADSIGDASLKVAGALGLIFLLPSFIHMVGGAKRSAMPAAREWRMTT